MAGPAAHGRASRPAAAGLQNRAAQRVELLHAGGVAVVGGVVHGREAGLVLALQQRRALLVQ